MIKLLHFADAHIDTIRQGRIDPESGLPLRALDFLNALDTIIDTAITQKVDLVIFAGDAYRDRTPAPTFQREWGKRIIKLSEAGIQTVLLTGNHDVSPAIGRAHTMQEFETLNIPNVHVIQKPCLLKSADLNLPAQVIGIPWLNRSGFAAAEDEDLKPHLEDNLAAIVEGFIGQCDPLIPTILTSHATVQGAVYGNERSIMLGRDFTVPKSLFDDPRLDYVALGHIHKFQNLNEGKEPPIVYSGSIERVDFGEANDQKCFMIINIEKGHTQFEFNELHGRKFIDKNIEITERENIQAQITMDMPSEDEIKDSIFRLVLSYPKDWEELIDEQAIRKAAESAFEFHLVKRPTIQARMRLPEGENIAAKTPMELLDLYWGAVGKPENADELNKLASEIMSSVDNQEGGK